MDTVLEQVIAFFVIVILPLTIILWAIGRRFKERVVEIKAKRQQAADKGNELQRKTYGNKEFRFNELIRKLRSAKVMNEATDKDSLSVHNSQTQK